MEFSLEQGLRMAITVVCTCLLLGALGNILTNTTKHIDKSTIKDSALPANDVNKPITGTNSPTLYIKTNIKISCSVFSKNESSSSILSKIKSRSNCSAIDSSGNTIDSSKIKLKMDNEDMKNFNYYLKNGGVVRVKYYVEDSKGRKTSTIKNIILRLPASESQHKGGA